MPAAELAAYLERHKSAKNIALLECFSQRVTLAEIGPQATLRRALQMLRDSDVDTLYAGSKVRTVLDPHSRRAYPPDDRTLLPAASLGIKLAMGTAGVSAAGAQVWCLHAATAQTTFHDG